eukprot:7005810-Alexandrium_andersonii.AAC.1
MQQNKHSELEPPNIENIASGVQSLNCADLSLQSSAHASRQGRAEPCNAEPLVVSCGWLGSVRRPQRRSSQGMQQF